MRVLVLVVGRLLLTGGGPGSFLAIPVELNAGPEHGVDAIAGLRHPDSSDDRTALMAAECARSMAD